MVKALNRAKAATSSTGTGSLTTSQSVVSGNTFTVATFDVEIPDPA